MRNKILFIFFFLSFYLIFGQQKITWKDLSKVKFTEKYFPDYDETLLHPKFSESVKALDGKRITITGYFLSLDLSEKYYILSKGPMSACYFCGIGGPETTIELQSLFKQKFKTDNIVSITGTLKLNDTDVEHFNYILTNCIGKLVK
ncbi:hypothetical protein [Tenacibaculum sp. nBUS_03]|uniref:hypothetical protein n=1 Tax=Tenacibaculum sp. nBUS_03 TaxID=3395320 RepID=UPI003EBDA638